ncbi:phosphoribosyltransferase [Flagellimonas lutaonensis]|uniref:Phosphoribosyltransferase n=1 Tax=Flagellimonas lutaonensis TaxID=516051 RepID=A0A0D5YQV5_9FLAO|nr:phosphoribosyltransferase family protein [Allomuricauda lutaonensis]AKA34273.1 Phosphoribosyltransferase [Allomuricauda lutaonensis]
MFKDRTDAALQLAEKLSPYKSHKGNIVVLAIPRGGLPLGAIVAKALDAPLDVALSKKLGHPYNREYAIGAVSLENVVLNEAVGVTKSYIVEESERVRKKLRKRHDQYYKNRFPRDLKGKTVIIVDDGIATGNTIKVTAQLVHGQKPKKTVVAIPVAPPSAVKNLEDSEYIDEVVCLNTPRNFHAVGQYYEEFGQVSDTEAMQLLEEANRIINP